MIGKEHTHIFPSSLWDLSVLYLNNMANSNNHSLNNSMTWLEERWLNGNPSVFSILFHAPEENIYPGTYSKEQSGNEVMEISD